MLEREIEQCGDFQIATARAKFGTKTWWAWAKMGIIQSDRPLKEPGEHVWFDFGSTRQDAAEKIKRELGLIHA